MKFFACFLICTLVAPMASTALADSGTFYFPEALIPRFNIPRTDTPPKIDGIIDPAEWKQAAKVMGMVLPDDTKYKDRPVSFWIAWDPTHLYIAARSDVLPGARLLRTKRERYTTDVVYDDAYEFGIFMNDRNKLPGEVSSFLKITLNALGAGEYMKIYPSIGQNMFNWQPDAKIANRVYEADGRQWWDMEMSMDLQDLQMPVENKVGDKLGILLAADLKNPGWQWLDYPSASGHLESHGFPRTILTDQQPYVQVDQLSGLHDQKIDLKSTIFNPSDTPITVSAALTINYNPPDKNSPAKVPADKAKDAIPHSVVDEKQTLTIPAHGSIPFNVSKLFPGLFYATRLIDDGNGGAKSIEVLNFCDLRFSIDRVDTRSAPPVYFYACRFGGTDKSYLVAEKRTIALDCQESFNPVSNRLMLTADTLDAAIPAGTTPDAMTYVIERDGTTIKEGRSNQLVDLKYQAFVDMPDLQAGKYHVTINLVDSAGKTLISRSDLTFEKKDEAKEFARWWHNDLGDTHKILKPFEPLAVKGAAVTCTRREYQLDTLGLPRQIIANGGNVLSRPARIVLTVGGKEYVVPTDGTVTMTSVKDWRLEFTGKSQVAGLTFSVKGWMEQDGLVNLALTYAPGTGPVAIDDLRVEWPVDGAPGAWMSCIGGVGGNYSPRTIGKVPDGTGQVWNSLTDIGKAGSTMLVGNWESNLWVGSEERGLCWFGDDDRGWVPNDTTPALSVFRDGQTVVMRNHLINLPKGAPPFVLDQPRTVNLQYNATPFRHFAPGWRLTQLSAAGGFSAPDYKANEKENNREYFALLSMPSADVKEWPYYLAKYKAAATAIVAREGRTNPSARLGKFLTNQLPIRGYMDKTLEPGLYDYFGADWLTGNESLNASYRDYMMNLMQMQVHDGGCTHFYFDISFTKSVGDIMSGFGYSLPDGRVQPGSMDATLREWYKRVWALMQENGLYPGGVSGHATHSICLRALPWTDAILDSEFPMQDPIIAYSSDAMIAMDCPDAFGVNINQLGFMNPAWASMHDSGQGGSAFPFSTPQFRHFGIAATDVEYKPYWRDANIVKPQDPGVLASVWTRPGKAIVQVLNYGLDPAGQEKTRSAKLTLNLGALGVPPRISADRIHISELVFDHNIIPGRYLGIYKWYQDLPGTPDSQDKSQIDKFRPDSKPTIDPASGVVDSVNLFYHDSRYLLITWDDHPVAPSVKSLLDPDELTAATDWGIAHASESYGTVTGAGDGIKLNVWTLPGTAMMLVRNTTPSPASVKLTADLDRLGVKVKRLYSAYTQCIGGTLDPQSGELGVSDIPARSSKVVFIDTFGP